MWILKTWAGKRPGKIAALLLALAGGSLAFAEQKPTPNDDVGEELEDVTKLAPLNVKGDRLEEFGFRLNVTIRIPGANEVTISEVFPNTAATKAGLKPGELISKVDGKSVSAWSLAFKPNKIQERKWAELAAGKKSVKLSLEVRAPGAKEPRTVTLILPSPAPHWGSQKWSAPEGRIPAVVQEAGPLAELAREVLDNGIWSGRQDNLGYEWRIVQPSGTHRIWVTQQRGKTEITLEYRARLPELEFASFLTSPSGALEKGRCVAPKKKGKRREFSAEEIRAQFEAEMDFWLTKVGRVTGRWPFEALAGDAGGPTMAINPGVQSGASSLVKAVSFLTLPIANAEQRALFADALGKVGMDEECWAYTETSRGFGDDRVTTVRIDPSKPPGDRSVLLKVNGKVPKTAALKQWREEGRGAPAVLGELPPLSSVVDLDDVRVFANETTAVVFELPVKSLGAEFPADKFQALFRVNKTQRGFEDFSVKLRESIRVAGVAKVTDAGMEVRFQSLDLATAPQPAVLKAGGGVRVLLVKFSRSFEATRTDFRRVVPFEEGTELGL